MKEKKLLLQLIIQKVQFSWITRLARLICISDDRFEKSTDA